MTQTITLVADHGIWQSSDMRTSIGNVTKDDHSIKHVIVNCPDGVALLSYAGAGSVRMGGKYIDISDWIRQILRGPGRGLDETFIYLRERADEDLGKLLFKEEIHHMAVSVRAYAEETNRRGRERRAEAETSRRALEKIERGHQRDSRRH